MKLNKKGFTLVELLAVIVVLAIIALIGFTAVGPIVESSRKSAAENNILQYKVIFMKLSESEYSIMEIIWAKKAPVTSQDICALSDQRGWKAPTVLTFLKRLCEKGVLESEKIGKLRYYTPLISKEDYARSEATTLVNDLYDGKISNLVTSMAGQIALTQEDRQALKKLLEGDWE